MKICILTHTFPKSIKDSCAPFMHALSLGLKKNGHEVFVIAPYTKGINNEKFPYEFITYKYIWPKFLHMLGYSQTLKNGTSLKFSTYLLFPFYAIFTVLALINLARKEKLDIISSHWLLPNGFFAFIVSKLLKIPYIVSLPGSDVYLAKKNNVFGAIAKISANNASSIIADSPHFLEEILSLKVSPKKTEIIPYPVIVDKKKVSLRDINLLRKKLDVKSGNIVILAVGRLIYKKGFDYLIKAIPILVKKHKNITLIVVGEGDLKEELQNLILKLKVSDYVKLVGNVNRSEIYNYYNLADIFVATSIKDENGNMDDQPVSLIEAMACGRPVVATNFPGIALTVKNGINGYLFPEKDLSSLISSLDKLISSKSLRIKMGKESKKIVLGELTDKKIGKRYTNFILETLKSAK